MKDYFTFSVLSVRWDFMDETTNGSYDYWGINPTENNGYPFLAWQGYSNEPTIFAGGDGTEVNPYQVETLTHLNHVKHYKDKHFIQIANIDASGTSVWAGGDGWEAIGTSTNEFTGVYDGNRFNIDGLTINRASTSYQGLFAEIKNALVKNIGLLNVEILGSSATGSITGSSLSSEIYNCYSTGSVDGRSYTGGLAGSIRATTIGNCFASVSVDGSSSYSDGYTGGLVGYNGDNSLIINCYATGDVVDGKRNGGLVGHNYSSSIENCYATGTVGSATYKGGLTAGSNSSTIINSFWDIETTGQASSSGGTGKTTAEMKNYFTFYNDGWDFIDEVVNGEDNDWGINPEENSGYPFLSFEGYTHITPVDEPIEVTNLSYATEFNGSWTPVYQEIDELEELNFSITAIDPHGNGLDYSWKLDDVESSITSTYDFTTNYLSAGNHTITLSVNNNFGSSKGNSRSTLSYSWSITVNDVDQSIVVNSLSPAEGPQIIDEGETINFVIDAFDPDGNDLTYSWKLDGVEKSNLAVYDYSPDYESAGSHIVSLDVTDNFGAKRMIAIGRMTGSHSIKRTRSDLSYSWDITVNDADQNIVINSLLPAEGPQIIDEGEVINFIIDAFDPDGNDLVYSWKLDGSEKSIEASYDFVTDYEGEGSYVVTLSVTDNYGSKNSLNYTWAITVNDATPAPAGLGTEADPYQIAILDHLLWITENTSSWDKYFIQTADIDASATSSWNSGEGWIPIGDSGVKFGGSYNGNGYLISGLTSNINNDRVGFFGYIIGGQVKNLGLVDINITGESYCGAIAGVFTTGSVIENCFATGSVNGIKTLGGLVGYKSESSITNSYASVSVTASDASSLSGGLVGNNRNSGTISFCFATGVVTGNTYIGGLVGANYNSPITNSLWDIEATGQNTSAGGGTGKITSEMKDYYTYFDTSWDFLDETVNGEDNLWGINSAENNGYPFLAWQGYEHIVPDEEIIVSALTYATNNSGTWTPVNQEIVEAIALSFSITAEDPDGRDLVYSWVLDGGAVSNTSTYDFTTDYSSAGSYIVSLDVTDGYGSKKGGKSRSLLSYTWNIIVNNFNSAPIITSFLPEELTVNVTNAPEQFKIIAEDNEDDELTYSWYINNMLQVDSTEFSFTNTFMAGNYEVKGKVYDGEFADSTVWTIVSSSSIDDNMPKVTSLSQNYPNPFNPITKINYQLSIINYKLAEIVVYNSAGQKVWASNPLTLNTNHCLFDGSKFNSGVYYYSLVVDGKQLFTRKMILTK